MDTILRIYIAITMAIFLSVVMITVASLSVEDAPAIRPAAWIALLCWAWPLALPVVLLWLLVKPVTRPADLQTKKDQR